MEVTYDDDRFAILQEVVSFSFFQSLMDSVSENQLRIGGRVVRLDSPTPPEGRPTPYCYSFESVERRWARERNSMARDYKTLACCGPKCAALEPMSRSSESLFQPLELERAPEESLARRGMERHDVAGPPVTAALVPS